MCMINDCSQPLQYYIWLSRHPLERYIWHVFINITGTTVSSLERHCDDDWGGWEQLECDSTSWQPSNSQVPAGPDIMVHMRKMWDKSAEYQTTGNDIKMISSEYAFLTSNTTKYNIHGLLRLCVNDKLFKWSPFFALFTMDWTKPVLF